MTENNQAFLIAQMTTAQRTALTPQKGMVIYDTDLNHFFGYENNNWIQLDKASTTSEKGTATLANGTATVNNTNVKADSKILVSIKEPRGVPGIVYATNINDSVSFTISSTSAGDSSDVNWGF